MQRESSVIVKPLYYVSRLKQGEESAMIIKNVESSSNIFNSCENVSLISSHNKYNTMKNYLKCFDKNLQ